MAFFAIVVGKFRFLNILMYKQYSLVYIEHKFSVYLLKILPIILNTTVVGFHQN
jgi:hypothetical protein